jgi:hypothetical protein
MSEFQDKVTTLVTRIKELEGLLGEAKKELRGLTGDLREQLRAVTNLVNSKGGTKGPGRPKGSATPEGGQSISQQVLEFIKSSPDGTARAAILASHAGHEAAVHAAIRQHQEKKRIYRHPETKRWYYDATSEKPIEATSENLIEESTGVEATPVV